jgi:phosphoglycerate dehydrogenase-like enzyme
VRVLFCGSGWLPFVDILARGLPPGASISLWDRATPLVQAVADIQVILPSNAPIDAAVIAAAPDLRLIQQPAAGTENIDLEAARARAIPVCNAPGANHTSVAEQALFLMLALVRRLPAATASFAAARIGEPVGRELRGRRLGIIGRGRSGTALARIAEGIGMTVAAIGSRRTDAEWETFLAEADVVSLHCPLTSATRGLLDDRAFALMKPGALVINCARGPVIDRAALEAALDRGQLGGAGLDVFWEEPWDPSDPLYRRPNVVVTPHIAGSTEESLERIAAIVGGNIDRMTRGAELLHRVA